ncbi:LLM class flavin-dependent oxidoreductase [Methylocaldum szegediense]|uniref:Flavin-dependent trigonelline monooxygenase, oxygenase component n=1 Tax=Methylocaldum szegediense TaxID=73780 RepID=A0ABM9I265_9GAMM|nr:LLM class flavin-dependent oxidoreductase [Methylocaldum szegediense]CAI8842218.1 flavin-dependent trigonelline monooxygenase, oxygenase component [Methylocaldum szegediense]
MNFGLFCFYENYDGDYAKVLASQTALVQYAEGLGFQEAWVAEHHFTDFGVSPSVLLLLAHLAGVTKRIRLGTAALLLPFHDPIKAAEDIATLDHLSGGRLNLGVAHGGPFPLQNRHFKVPPETARTKMLEALELIVRLLGTDKVSHSGTHFQIEGVTTHPKPLQRPIPVFLASQNPEVVHHAANRGYGLLGGQGATIDKLKPTLAHYPGINPSSPKPLTLLRTFYVAKTRAAALAVALPSIRRFRERMRTMLADNGEPSGLVTIEVDRLLENALIGDVAECRDKIQKLREELDLNSLVLKPAANDPAANRYSLSLFGEEVMPYV